MGQTYFTVMGILGEIGVAFKLPEAVNIFKQHGFKTNGNKVFFEESQVLRALETVPGEFTIMARNPEKSVRLGGEHFAFGPAWGAPFVIDADGTRRNGTLAQEIYFFHWGFHAWAIYAIVGLTMAYFNFRKDRGSLVSGCLVPIFGEKLCNGLLGKIVDSFAVWATLFGVVTGLGSGAMQMTGGLSYLFGFANTPFAVAMVITFITVCFVISALSGIGRGIKFLSNLNIVLMLILFSFFLIVGPTSFLLKNFSTTIGAYLTDLPELSFSTVLFGNEAWTRGWTVFYWAFWIAWAPFVGGFIARVSRGRTIREFVFMVLFAPAVFSFIFSSVIGGTGIYMDLFEGTAIGKVALELSLYETLKHMPMGTLMSIVGVLLATSFVVTSADSATYVMARLCTQGKDPENPKLGNRLTIVWGVLLGVLTIGFSYSGGLNGLKASTIIGSVPFIIIMFLCIIALVKALLKEKIAPETTGAADPSLIK